MGNWYNRLIVCLLSLFVSANCMSQDIQYSQFYANVIYLNPAFAGNAHALRGMYHQRVQWPALDAKYITSHFSLDHYFSQANSGVGLMVYKDWQGANTLASTEVALQYAYELHLTTAHTFRAGLQTSYVTRAIDYSVLTFPDQYSANGYLGKNTNQPYSSGSVRYLDFTTGGIFYSDRYWLGLTYAHINRPEQSFYGEGSRLPYKLEYTAGYRIDLQKKHDLYKSDQGKDVYLTPTVHYKLQGKSDQLDLGLYMLYDHLIAGFWYRGIPILKRYRGTLQNNESIVALIGWRVQNLSLSYSYDATVSKLVRAGTAGSHEINITYLYDLTKKKRKVMKKIPCPHFYK